MQGARSRSGRESSASGCSTASAPAIGSERQAPFLGARTRLDGPPAAGAIELPPALSDCRLIAVPIDGQDVGIIHDERTRALTAVVAVRVRAVGLLPTSEHEARLARWGQVLASLARARQHDPPPADPAARASRPTATACGGTTFRQSATTLPEDSRPGALVHVAARRSASRSPRTTRSCSPSRSTSGAPGRAPRATRRAEDSPRRAGRTASLLRELRTLVEPLRQQPTSRSPASSPPSSTPPRSAAPTTRSADPYRDAAVEAYRRARLRPDRGRRPRGARYRADGAWHRTYWISQWPRLPVGPLFLTPLLLGAHAVHSVSVVIEPIAPDSLAARGRGRDHQRRGRRGAARAARASARPRGGGASRTRRGRARGGTRLRPRGAPLRRLRHRQRPRPTPSSTTPASASSRPRSRPTSSCTRCGASRTSASSTARCRSAAGSARRTGGLL